jgi:ketosteroid isomerase-like protein
MPFYKAYAARDANKIGEFLDDDVEWTISGPVYVLPFCGTRHGNAAVLDLIDRLVPEVFRVFSFVPDAVLVDGDQHLACRRHRRQRLYDEGDHDEGRRSGDPGGRARHGYSDDHRGETPWRLRGRSKARRRPDGERHEDECSRPARRSTRKPLRPPARWP